MADEGLFSNLKFTDIFFPAAATVASAYSPHAARGLQSGMNMFNTFAAFQNDARKWKEITAQQKLLKEQLEQGQAAVGEYLEPIEGRASEIERRWTEAYRDELDYPQGAEGATIASVEEPLSEEDFKQMMEQQITSPPEEGGFALGVAPEAQAGLMGDPAGQFQDRMAATAPPKFTEAAPWYLEQQVEGALFDDPEYQALQREINLSKLMGGTMGLSPGAATSVLGYSALGSQDLAQERERLATTMAEQEAYAQNRFLEGQLSKRQETQEQQNRANIWQAKKAADYEAWAQTADQIQSLTEDNINQMSLKDLITAKNRTLALIKQAEEWGEASNPLLIADLYATLEFLNTRLPTGAGVVRQPSDVGETPGSNAVLGKFGG